jgi:hypothetical protein
MTKPRIWLGIALALVAVLLCAALWLPIAKFLPSFPEIFFGQVVLTRDTKPLSPRAYQSAEFVLSQVAHSDIEGAVFVALDRDVLFWDPQYAGFARTELSLDEIGAIQQSLATGYLFYPAPDGSSYSCVTKSALQEPLLETCAPGKLYMEQYLDTKRDAEKEHTVGVLQVSLTGGRMAEIRVYCSEDGLAYTPYEKSGDWWLDGIAGPSPLVDELFDRVTVSPITVLWPELTAARANTRAARIVGDRYPTVLEIIQNSAAVREALGGILEIRPATGNNYTSSWMDSQSVFLTFRVVGPRGESAVIVRGYDCFDLQMVFGGIPLDDAGAPLCP